MKGYFFFIIVFVIAACGDKSSKQGKDNTYVKEAWINANEGATISPLSKSRIDLIKRYQKTGKDFLPLKTEDANKQLAQNIIASEPKIRQFTEDPESKKPFLVEMFEIEKANAGNISKRVKYNENLYQALLYNFATNSTLKLTVDIVKKQVVDANFYETFQPDLNAYHEKLAIDIATQSPKVLEALGRQPTERDALMASTKTALNKTKCERSMHLCCAPTFVKGGKALWAIVDLTDLRLIGIRWTNVGDAGPTERISERNLLIDKVEECNCKEVTTIEKGDWKLDYMLTKSDGLRVSDAFYKGIVTVSDTQTLLVAQSLVKRR